MRKIDTKEIEELIYKMALDAGVSLTDSCKKALYAARDGETEGAAKFALGAVRQL